MSSYKPINQGMRPVEGGAVRRVWLGDCWRWECYDVAGQRLPGLMVRTLALALQKVAVARETAPLLIAGMTEPELKDMFR